MKGQGKWKKSAKRKKDNGKLQKYMLSVDEFVQSKRGCDEEESDDGLRFVKKKSRKELRKEKRKMKKAKMKSYYEGKNSLSLPIGGDGEGSGITADKPQQQQGKEVKEEAKKQVSKTPQTKSTHAATETPEESKKQSIPKKGKKINRLQESRKKALLEANEAEDREIKKLERYLGLNKRKNKKNLPQSFAADGLDYILGVLDSGSSAAGVYDSDDDMDMAKEKLKRLEKSDSEMSGEEDESKDGSGKEGSENDSDQDVDSMDNENEDADELSDEEEAEEEEMEEEEELDESDVADSDNEGEAETETDNHNTKTGTVSSEI